MHPENPHSNVRDVLTSYQQRHPPLQKSMANEVETIRIIAQRMLHALDEYTQQACAGNQENTTFWNGKESPLSVLVKLTQVLTRLQDIACDGPPEETKDIPENDMERLKAYARRLSVVGEDRSCQPAEK